MYCIYYIHIYSIHIKYVCKCPRTHMVPMCVMHVSCRRIFGTG